MTSEGSSANRSSVSRVSRLALRSRTVGDASPANEGFNKMGTESSFEPEQLVSSRLSSHWHMDGQKSFNCRRNRYHDHHNKTTGKQPIVN